MSKNYNFIINGNKYNVDIQSFEQNIVTLEVNGTPYNVELDREIKKVKTPKLVRSRVPTSNAVRPLTSTGFSKVEAPLPGNILEVKVKEGDTVKTDDVLLIMEAMKMENRVLAEKDGTIKSVKVAPGDAVLQGDVLIEMQ